jgi:hypothetical protein
MTMLGGRRVNNSGGWHYIRLSGLFGPGGDRIAGTAVGASRRYVVRVVRTTAHG